MAESLPVLPERACHVCGAAYRTFAFLEPDHVLCRKCGDHEAHALEAVYKTGTATPAQTVRWPAAKLDALHGRRGLRLAPTHDPRSGTDE